MEILEKKLKKKNDKKLYLKFKLILFIDNSDVTIGELAKYIVELKYASNIFLITL